MHPFPVHGHFQFVQFLVIGNGLVGGILVLLEQTGNGQIKALCAL